MSDRPWRSPLAGLILAITAATLTGAPAIAAPEPTGAVAAAVDHLVARGVDRAEAIHRISTQDALSRTAERLAGSLGNRAAGTFIQADQLVIAVTDEAAAQEAKAAGAQPRRVPRTADALAGTRRQLQRLLKGMGGTSTHTDVRTNTVIATIPDGAAGDALAAKANAIDGVTVRRTTGELSTQANLYGGQQIEFTQGTGNYVCSVGFTATDRNGANVMITAGHCADGIANGEFRRNGTYLATVQSHSFPTDDHAYATLGEDWTPQPAVTKYNGTAITVTGHSRAAVGSTVCKSGRTTGWTCGEVEAHDVTVNYSDGTTVEEMTETSVCTEGGDSGGSWLAGAKAQGVTSGGVGYRTKDTNGDGRIDSKDKAECGEKVGKPNVAWFQPIAEILNTYDLTLKTGS